MGQKRRRGDARCSGMQSPMLGNTTPAFLLLLMMNQRQQRCQESKNSKNSSIQFGHKKSFECKSGIEVNFCSKLVGVLCLNAQCVAPWVQSGLNIDLENLGGST